jgi:hypothetical protein
MMFKIIVCTSLIYFAVFTALTAAEVSAQVGPPVLSFVPDGTGALRPLIGVAGAATIGAPLELGLSVVQLAIPPDHDYILATAEEIQSPIWLQLHEGTPAIRSLDGVSNIDRIAISPTGSAAAFLSESDGRIYSFVNLSRSPLAVSNFEIGGLGPTTAFAITDDGQTGLWGTSDGVSGSVFVLKALQQPRLIASTTHPSAIQFLLNGDSAIIADDIENEILWFSNGQVSTIATAADGILAPSALAVSRDNRKIFVGSSKAASVTKIETFTTVGEPVYCNCTLTGLYPTNTDSVFRLNTFTGRPILLFDGSLATSRITYVPVATQY